MASLEHSYTQCVTDDPVLIAIDSSNLCLLQRIVGHSRQPDPFSRSAAYYAMTGRKGLWLYGDTETAMVIARHPNRDDTLLFFPPIGVAPQHLIGRALRDHRLPACKIELARLNPQDHTLITGLRDQGAKAPASEEVLDWGWPVHVVSPALITACKGGAFNTFRGHLNKAVRDGLQAETIDIKRHKAALLEVVDQWADQKGFDGYSREDLTGPTKAAIGHMEQSGLNIKGILTRDAQGCPLGFWLWEETGETAMSLVRVALKQRGNAELGIMQACRALTATGIPELCLGGSESRRLDDFKRKMQPLYSVELCTMTLRIRPDCDRQTAPSAASGSRHPVYLPSVNSQP